MAVLLETIANRFAAKFRFGFHEIEDIKQEAKVLALEGLKKFNPDKGFPLEHFLTVHVRNRLINFKRDTFYRGTAPCFTCPFYDPKLKKSTSGCAEFKDKLECDKYALWHKRNKAKRSLAESHELTVDLPIIESKDVLDSELCRFILSKMPAPLRADYMRMLEGINIPKWRRENVQLEVTNIIESNGLLDEREQAT